MRSSKVQHDDAAGAKDGVYKPETGAGLFQKVPQRSRGRRPWPHRRPADAPRLRPKATNLPTRDERREKGPDMNTATIDADAIFDLTGVVVPRKPLLLGATDAYVFGRCPECGHNDPKVLGEDGTLWTGCCHEHRLLWHCYDLDRAEGLERVAGYRVISCDEAEYRPADAPLASPDLQERFWALQDRLDQAVRATNAASRAAEKRLPMSGWSPGADFPRVLMTDDERAAYDQAIAQRAAAEDAWLALAREHPAVAFFTYRPEQCETVEHARSLTFTPRWRSVDGFPSTPHAARRPDPTDTTRSPAG